MILSLPEVAIAILYQNHRFLMQLRDDIPGIVYPGSWGFFGGHLEPGETPEAALVRELQEEIHYTPPVLEKFACYQDAMVIRHVFAAPLTVSLDQLVLCEGWDLGLITPAEIQAGYGYSNKARDKRAIAAPHQKILLDFLQKIDQFPS